VTPPIPTLGTKWNPNAEGFGTVRPARIFNGGDPTGLLMNVTWSSWGGSTAKGMGTGYYEPPNAPVAASTAQPADVEAFDLGTCKGKPAYLRVQWWFPGKGESFHATGNEASYNICTGSA
jgi:hypothetical protein